VKFQSKGELVSRFTGRVDFVLANSLADGVLQGIGVLLVARVVQHVHGCVQHGNWVGDVLSGDGCARVTGAWLENGVLQFENFNFLSLPQLQLLT
jgi:hypothetical protein